MISLKPFSAMIRAQSKHTTMPFLNFDRKLGNKVDVLSQENSNRFGNRTSVTLDGSGFHEKPPHELRTLAKAALENF